MSKARKHCKFDKCESCEYHRKRNNWIRDSESVDTLDDGFDENGRRKTEDQRDLDREAPDDQDYHSWDLDLIRRKAHNDEWQINRAEELPLIAVQKPKASVGEMARSCQRRTRRNRSRLRDIIILGCASPLGGMAPQKHLMPSLTSHTDHLTQTRGSHITHPRTNE